MRPLGGVSNPARQLFHVELAATNRIQGENLADGSADLFRIETEPPGRVIAELNRAYPDGMLYVSGNR
jgi:hypothetical protein